MQNAAEVGDANSKIGLKEMYIPNVIGGGKWYLNQDCKIYGPMSWYRLKSKANQAEISPNAQPGRIDRTPESVPRIGFVLSPPKPGYIRVILSWNYACVNSGAPQIGFVFSNPLTKFRIFRISGFVFRISG